MNRVTDRHPDIARKARRRTSSHLLAWAGMVVVVLGAKGCGEESRPTPEPPGGQDGVALELVASGLEFPLGLTAPEADSRLFVVEKGGRIRIVRDGALLPEPFLDISATVSRGSEQGLLGLAFHPDYATTGRFFVDYTDSDGNTRISAWRVSADADRADAASEEVLLTIEQPFSNHNGGGFAFGPDGYLYVGMGDGGSGGDPLGNGRDLGDLLGSLLRIDVNGPSGYAIPADNPFVGREGARGELWDLGLRNPWRFSFDRGTGDLYIADVGQGEREEIDVATRASGGGRGLDYGWNVMEGSICYGGGSCDRTGLALPVTEYSHDQGCSVTGGYVYRGTAVPAIQGHYFYADYCQGWVRSFRLQDGAASDPRDWPALAPGGPVASFGEDAAGELYVLDAGGSVYRVVAAP
jgi:glucose/arabinose dehydrogenase